MLQLVTDDKEKTDRIEQVVSLREIREAMETGTFTVEKYLGVATSLHTTFLQELENEEERAAAWAAWDPISQGLANGSCSALVDFLRFLTTRLTKARTRISNERIQKIRPVIENLGVKYELAHTMKNVQKGEMTLDTVQNWMKRAVEREITEGRASLQHYTQRTEEVLKITHINAVLDLLENRSFGVGVFPVTLRLDRERLQEGSAEMQLSAFAWSVGLQMNENQDLRQAFVSGAVNGIGIAEFLQGMKSKKKGVPDMLQEVHEGFGARFSAQAKEALAAATVSPPSHT